MAGAGANTAATASTSAASAPNWLAPMTQQAIVKQATNTIGKSYAPSYQELNQDQQRQQAISDKRTSDNQYYETWLNTQAEALQAHADTANTQILAAQKALDTGNNDLWAQQSQDLVTSANARMGNVSNNAQSTPLTTNLQQNEQEQGQLMGASENNLYSNMLTGNDALGAARANNNALVQVAQNKQLSDLQTAMTTLGTQRSKLESSEGGDIQKEIARLQGVEVQKAQANRDYTTTAEELGLKEADTESEIQARAAGAATAAKNANTSAARLSLSTLQDNRTYNLNVQKYNSATAKDIYERDNGLGPYKNAANKPLSMSSQNVIYNKVDSVKSQLQTVMTQAGVSSAEAQKILLSGQSYSVKTATGTSVVHPRAVTDKQLLQAAYDAQFSGGLTAADISYLKGLGLATPGKRYGLATAPGKGVASGGSSFGGI